MPAYKDKNKGTWYVAFYYVDWTGQRKKKHKRGFKTKREANEFEAEFKRTAAGEVDMKMKSFVETYFRDKEGELKERSIKNKRYMMEAHILPYFGNKSLNEISAADIINWQNIIREKQYAPTYMRMLQNQMTALFTHAQRIYNLTNNPCKKVKKMGKADADKLEF